MEIRQMCLSVYKLQPMNFHLSAIESDQKYVNHLLHNLHTGYIKNYSVSVTVNM